MLFKKLLVLTLSSFLVFGGFSTYPSYSEALPGGAECSAYWFGEVDVALVRQVREDLSRAITAKCPTFYVELHSPGGSVVQGFEIIRFMREAKQHGLIIEMHGGAVVASMAVPILASASKGHRYAELNTLTVIHSMTKGYVCVEYTPNPKTEDEAVTNQLIRTFAAIFADATGEHPDRYLPWFTCGFFLVGNAELLKALKLIDHIDT